jgi:hypothetical protein
LAGVTAVFLGVTVLPDAACSLFFGLQLYMNKLSDNKLSKLNVLMLTQFAKDVPEPFSVYNRIGRCDLCRKNVTARSLLGMLFGDFYK